MTGDELLAAGLATERRSLGDRVFMGGSVARRAVFMGHGSDAEDIALARLIDLHGRRALTNILSTDAPVQIDISKMTIEDELR